MPKRIRIKISLSQNGRGRERQIERERESVPYRDAAAEQIGKVTNALLKIGLTEHVILSTCYGRDAGMPKGRADAPWVTFTESPQLSKHYNTHTCLICV